MIKIDNLKKVFNKGQVNEINALQDINLNIADGEYLVMIGANGSGKSTLLNCISGSILSTSGSIKLDGQDVSRLKDYNRSKWVARVFQNPLSGTAPGLSILDNFRLASIRTKQKNIAIGVDSKFTAEVKKNISRLNLGLEDKLDTLMGSLSGGQRQALTLLMSVMDECKILLLDEPTAALDPRSAEKVMQIADSIITQFKLTAILVTHNLKEAYTHGTRLIQLAEGAILRDVGTDQKARLKQNELFEWFT